MKRLFIICISIISIISCTNVSNNGKEAKKQRNSLDSLADTQNAEIGGIKVIQDKVDSSNSNVIEGIWAENENENALFFIKDGYLYYTENQSNAIPIEVANDTLIIKNELVVICHILKLTNDSLWFFNEYSNDTTKLFKRK